MECFLREQEFIVTNLKISIIIACYNEEAVIGETNGRIFDMANKYHLQNLEVIYVNDGSTDRTREYLDDIASTNKQVKVFHLSKNFGHQPAMAAGIHHCSGDVAVLMDADLQDPPDLIREMIRMYEKEKCNVVYGVRKSRNSETFFKKITAKLFYRFLNTLSETPFPLDTGDFRLIDRKVINTFNQLQERNKYIRGLISWIGFKQCPIFYDRDKRFAGKTKFSLTKMIQFALTAIFYFTKKPLLLVLNLGFACVSISLFLTIYVVVIRFTNQPSYMTGWASTMISIIFFGGIQLLTVGIIGIYLGNVFDEVKKRPEYIIEEAINSDHRDTDQKNHPFKPDSNQDHHAE
ncbi:MAG: glycosyltransferase family 2 protein [Pseudomonadota bacterium]